MLREYHGYINVKKINEEKIQQKILINYMIVYITMHRL